MEPLTVDQFLAWLEQHLNCITRVATPSTVLYDDDSLHWHLSRQQGVWVVQAIRGKRLCGEILVDVDSLTYVLPLDEEQDEFSFEAVIDNKTSQLVAYVFSFTHGFEDDDALGHGASVH